MSQSQSQPEPDYKFTELGKLAVNRDLKYSQFRTQLRNLMLAYLHALTQSKFELTFFDNGAIKGIAPKGESG